DHVHMLISIPPKYAVSQVIGFIKGKSAIHLARVYGERKRNFVGQHFWARGYFVSTVGRDTEVIRDYIRKQEEEDMRLDQMNLWRCRSPSGGHKQPGPRQRSHSRFERLTDSKPPALPGDAYFPGTSLLECSFRVCLPSQECEHALGYDPKRGARLLLGCSSVRPLRGGSATPQSRLRKTDLRTCASSR